MNDSALLESYLLTPSLNLKNRIVMAPMTRRQADENGEPTTIMADYYARRASAGLMITEGTLISEDAIGYGNVPGIYTKKQIEKWRLVTDKVHANNGLIFMQLWHCGRISHSNFHAGRLPLAPSVLPLNMPLGKTGLLCGRSRQASIEDIQKIMEDFTSAAINAMHAGFDGVEIHGANGYLVDQFLHVCSNQREDRYGKTIENKARFCLELIESIGHTIGFERIGVRLSPGGHMNAIETMPADEPVFIYLLKKLDHYPIAYVHTGHFNDNIMYESLSNQTVSEFIRTHYHGTLIASGGYNIEKAQVSLKNNASDLVSFGKLFIANPDLVERLPNQLPLMDYRPEMLNELLY